MLSAIGFLTVGFVGGVLLTAIVAFHFYGLLYAETRRIVDEHSSPFFGISLRSYEPRRHPARGSES